MSVISAGLVAILAALAALHLYWGLGGCWPGKDAVSLSERVAGTSRKVASRLGPCIAVATALLAAAAIVVIRHTTSPIGFAALAVFGGYAALVLVFGLRGFAPYVSPVFNYARHTPFFKLNRHYYAPLCLLIATAFVMDFPPGADHALRSLFA